MPCNLCGSIDVEEISRADRDNNYLRTVICRKCGLVWSDPRPDEDEIKKFYTKDYRIAYKGTYQPKLKHTYRAGKSAAQRFLFFKEIIKPGDTILDIGAGGGEFVYLLRKMGYEAFGIEPNEGYGNYAKTQLNLPVEVGFAQQADLPANHYSVVTMHHVVEHLDDPFLILSKVRESLGDGGFLVIEVPNIEGTCFAPIHRFHQAHLYSFNPETLETIGRKAGFAVHKLQVSSDGGVITAIFRKEQNAEQISGEIPGNYEKILKTLKHHTALSHYLTSNPYIRPVRRLQKSIDEALTVRKDTTGKDLLDRIVQNLQKDLSIKS